MSHVTISLIKHKRELYRSDEKAQNFAADCHSRPVPSRLRRSGAVPSPGAGAGYGRSHLEAAYRSGHPPAMGNLAMRPFGVRMTSPV